MATLTAIFNAQDNLSKAMANAGNAGSKTTGIMQKLGKIGSVAMKGIITAVVAAGTALVALGKKAVNVGMSYESSMSQVMATMGLDKSTEAGLRAYETLSAAAEKMGATTAFSTTEAADALNYLALAGYDANKAAAALPTVLYLAGAGAMDLASASDMLTDAMSALQIEATQENLTEFSDKLAKTASSSNTSVAQLGEAVLAVGGTAANLKGGVTELTASLGILADAGIKGAEGGTHLRNMINALQSGRNKNAAKLFKKMGFSAYDAEGNMRSLGDQFKDINSYIAGMDAKGVDNLLRTIFKTTDLAAARAMLAATSNSVESLGTIVDSSLTGTGKTLSDYGVDLSKLAKTFDPLMTQEQFASDMLTQFGLDAETAGIIFEGLSSIVSGTGTRFDELTNKIDNSAGACEAMYRTMLDNLKGDVSIFNSTVEALYIEIFKSTNGVLRNLVQTGTGYMQRLIDAFKEGGFSGLSTEIGNVLGDATGVILGYMPKMIQAGTGVVLALVDSIGNNADTIANAAAEIALHLGGAILKIAPKLASSFVKVMGAAGKALIWSIPKLFSAVPDSVYNALGFDKGHVVAKVYQFAAALKASISKLLHGDVFGAVDSIGRAFNFDTGTIERVKSILTGIGDAFSKVSAFAQKAAGPIGNFIRKFVSIGGIEATITGLVAAFGALKVINIGKSFLNIAKGIKNAGGVMKLLAANKITLIVAAIAALAAAGVLLYKNWDKVSEAAKNVGEKIKDTFSNIGSNISTWFGDTKKWASEKWNGFQEAWANGNVGGWMKNQVNGLGQKIKGWFGDVKSWATQKWDDLKNAWNNSNIGQWFNEQFSGLGDKLGEWFGPVGTWASEKWEQIKTGWNASNVGQWFNEQFSGIGAKLGEWFGPVSDWASEKWESLKTAWNNGTIGDWFSEQFTGLGAKLGEWFGPASAWATEKWTEIQNAWNSSDVGQWFNTQFSGLGDKIGEWFGDVGSWASEKWTGLTNAFNNGDPLGWFSEQFSGISDKFTEWFGGIQTALEPLTSVFETIGTTISETFSDANGGPFGAISDIKTKIGEIGEKFLGVGQKIGPAFQNIGTAVLGVFGVIATTAISLFNGIQSAIGPFIAAIASMVGVAVDLFSGLLSLLGGDFSGAWESLKSAFGGFGDTLSNLGGVVVNFFTGMWTMASNIAGAVEGAFSGIGEAVRGIWQSITDGIVTMVNNAIDVINGMIDGVNKLPFINLGNIEHIGEDNTKKPGYGRSDLLADKARQSAEGTDLTTDLNAPTMDFGETDAQVQQWVSDFEQSMQMSEVQMPEVNTASFDQATDATEALRQKVDEASNMSFDLEADTSSITSAQTEIENAMSNLQLDGMRQSLVSGIQNAVQGMKLDDVLESSGMSRMDFDSLASAMGIDAAALEGAINGALASADPAAALTGMFAGVDLSTMLQPVGQGVGQGVAVGIESSAGEAAAAAASMGAEVIEAAHSSTGVASPSSMTIPVGEGIAQGVVVGLESGSPAAVAAVNAMGTSIVTALSATAATVDLSNAGTTAMSTLASGINSNASAATNAIQSAGNSIKSTANSINLTAAGAHVMRGLVVGMNSMRGTLMATARNIANQLKQTIQSGMEVASPSKFTIWVGKMTGLGLVTGLESMAEKATAAATNMALGVTSAFAPVAVETPTIGAPASATVSPYEVLEGDQNTPETSSERRILIDINGSGSINISGLTRAQAMELIAERLKPELMNVLGREILEGGDGVYEF